jgi:hypothetical protein
MKKTVLFVAIGALVLATLACGNGGNGGNGGGGGGGGSGDVELTMINNSGDTVCYVYISPTTDDTWGDDWLGSTETISNGSRRTFYVSPGNYDLRADDCSGNAMVEEYGVNLNSDTDWTISP